MTFAERGAFVLKVRKWRLAQPALAARLAQIAPAQRLAWQRNQEARQL